MESGIQNHNLEDDATNMVTTLGCEHPTSNDTQYKYKIGDM